MSHVQLSRAQIMTANRSGKLDMHGQHLTVVPEGVWVITSLNTLDLSGNNIKEISPAIANCKSLQVLILDDNSTLTSLPRELALIPALRYISLLGCRSLPPEVTAAYNQAKSAPIRFGSGARDARPVVEAIEALARARGGSSSSSSSSAAPPQSSDSTYGQQQQQQQYQYQQQQQQQQQQEMQSYRQTPQQPRGYADPRAGPSSSSSSSSMGTAGEADPYGHLQFDDSPDDYEAFRRMKLDERLAQMEAYHRALRNENEAAGTTASASSASSAQEEEEKRYQDYLFMQQLQMMQMQQQQQRRDDEARDFERMYNNNNNWNPSSGAGGASDYSAPTPAAYRSAPPSAPAPALAPMHSRPSSSAAPSSSSASSQYAPVDSSSSSGSGRTAPYSVELQQQQQPHGRPTRFGAGAVYRQQREAPFATSQATGGASGARGGAVAPPAANPFDVVNMQPAGVYSNKLPGSSSIQLGAAPHPSSSRDSASRGGYAEGGVSYSRPPIVASIADIGTRGGGGGSGANGDHHDGRPPSGVPRIRVDPRVSNVSSQASAALHFGSYGAGAEDPALKYQPASRAYGVPADASNIDSRPPAGAKSRVGEYRPPSAGRSRPSSMGAAGNHDNRMKQVLGFEYASPQAVAQAHEESAQAQRTFAQDAYSRNARSDIFNLAPNEGYAQQQQQLQHQQALAVRRQAGHAGVADVFAPVSADSIAPHRPGIAVNKARNESHVFSSEPVDPSRPHRNPGSMRPASSDIFGSGSGAGGAGAGGDVLISPSGAYTPRGGGKKHWVDKMRNESPIVSDPSLVNNRDIYVTSTAADFRNYGDVNNRDNVASSGSGYNRPPSGPALRPHEVQHRRYGQQTPRSEATPSSVSSTSTSTSTSSASAMPSSSSSMSSMMQASGYGGYHGGAHYGSDMRGTGYDNAPSAPSSRPSLPYSSSSSSSSTSSAAQGDAAIADMYRRPAAPAFDRDAWEHANRASREASQRQRRGSGIFDPAFGMGSN